MKPFSSDAASSRAALGLATLLSSFFVRLASCQDGDECRAYQWDSGALRVRGLSSTSSDPEPTEGVTFIVQPGEVNCRYWATTPSEVSYYTCTWMARQYEISKDVFFSLNPDLGKDCDNIKSQTEYCVAGFVEPNRAVDGRCGPQHNNATCIGTTKQCCNSATWTCGNSTEDCAPGTCYEGDCLGDAIYSTDGTCGQAHGFRSCAGRWGTCCSLDGRCGSGEAFCGLFACQHGDCDIWKKDEQPAGTKWTTDGTCGGYHGQRCSAEWGRCCNVHGVCGEKPADCYVERGCQDAFGICASGSTSAASKCTSTTTTTTTSTCMSSSTALGTATSDSSSNSHEAASPTYEATHITSQVTVSTFEATSSASCESVMSSSHAEPSPSYQ